MTGTPGTQTDLESYLDSLPWRHTAAGGRMHCLPWELPQARCGVSPAWHNADGRREAGPDAEGWLGAGRHAAPTGRPDKPRCRRCVALITADRGAAA